MRGNPFPVRQEEAIFRPLEPIQLFDKEVVNDTTARLSDAIECAPYRHFGLYIYIDSTSTPTDIHIEVEFLDRWSGRWHSLKQDVFASLYYEDADTASGLAECFYGMCMGRQIRVKLTGSGTTSSAYFTVSIGLDLWS
jgi:hypothetical protein